MQVSRVCVDIVFKMRSVIPGLKLLCCLLQCFWMDFYPIWVIQNHNKTLIYFGGREKKINTCKAKWGKAVLSERAEK